MQPAPRSPRILSVSWGKMEIEDIGTGKDFVLYPGGGHEWDWSVTGMGHAPGVRPVDIQELLDRGATAVVLSRGMDLRLQVDPATLELLAARGVTVHVLQTEEAVRIYNELAGTVAAAGLFHSTC